MIKEYDKWNNQKKDIDSGNYKPPLFNEREIWWCSLGINIGSEVCGKNKNFRRPILIIKKLSKTSFIGVPLSIQEREGTWYLKIRHSGGVVNFINLAQIKYIDYKRVDKKLGIIDSEEFIQVKDRLKNLLNL